MNNVQTNQIPAALTKLGVVRGLLFALLRVYVAIEQSAVVGWLLGRKPDLIIEPLPRQDDTVPEVHDSPSLFLSADLRAAYTHDGRTLRRVAQDDTGNLVFIRKASKQERRAIRRSKVKSVNARA